MPNPFVHVELNSSDVNASKRFYGSLFDWKLEDVPMDGMTYTMVKVGEGTGGGMMKHPMPEQPSVWIPYVQVNDIRASTAKAGSLGGKVIVDSQEIPGGGTFSVIQDPTGAVFGLFQTPTR
jgi:predicted enzyme related to lactoylglutathione lyase